MLSSHWQNPVSGFEPRCIRIGALTPAFLLAILCAALAHLNFIKLSKIKTTNLNNGELSGATFGLAGSYTTVVRTLLSSPPIDSNLWLVINVSRIGVRHELSSRTRFLPASRRLHSQR